MKYKLFALLALATFFAFAQQEDAWVYFTDKPDADYYLNNPLEMLTQRALDRRAAQGIPLDETDVPIHEDYVNEINGTAGITVYAKSKWFNCVHVRGSVSNIQSLLSKDFVDHIEYANPNVFSKNAQPVEVRHIDKWKDYNDKSMEDFDYGTAYNQAHMIRADYLHEQGYAGEEMIIAILDGGFDDVNSINAFDHLFDNGQILGTHNYVNDTDNVYSGTYSHHGTMVLSTIGGLIPGQFAGTAPNAKFYLFVTEDVLDEYILEESNWVEAAEEADRLGVDVVNTSLGYSFFDNSNHDHSYADMDGETTFISRGAEMLSSKGIILCNSAGNSGSDSWHYITAPADADGILTVGAVNSDESITYFSSWGPSYDGRVKPDVCAQGGNSAVVSTYGPDYASGTSFSSPIMCGAVACLWQAFPYKTNLELMQIVRESADRYNNPDDQYGYGIPNLELAYVVTLGTESLAADQDVQLYPNPVSSTGYVTWDPSLNITSVQVADITGKTLVSKHSDSAVRGLDIPGLPAGMYFMTLTTEDGQSSVRKLLVR